MKTIIVLALALSASSAMASLGKSSSWSEIFASGADLIFEENLGGISLDNACLTAGEVKSIRPVKTCAQFVPVEVRDGDMTYTDYVCKQWTMAYLSVSRVSDVKACAEYSHSNENMECVRFETKRATVGSTINVSVVEDSYSDHSNWPGFTKQFTFPACK